MCLFVRPVLLSTLFHHVHRPAMAKPHRISVTRESPVQKWRMNNVINELQPVSRKCYKNSRNVGNVIDLLFFFKKPAFGDDPTGF